LGSGSSFVTQKIRAASSPFPFYRTGRYGGDPLGSVQANIEALIRLRQ
jgi:hypothetical protein